MLLWMGKERKRKLIQLFVFYYFILIHLFIIKVFYVKLQI